MKFLPIQGIISDNTFGINFRKDDLEVDNLELHNETLMDNGG